MEDALAHKKKWPLGVITKVLILVLMEDALAPLLKDGAKMVKKVLILVLMEDALAPVTGYVCKDAEVKKS